ncbi:NrdH-redoxin [Bacillus cereus]|uniref:glutaredoxin family protein n=1 Tax=Bacillus cereus group TaxID=86661 RepID=UPI0009788F9B|nr:glutaredoxin family protein [Bacillus paranthracis]MCD1182157.1 glutaredoxin family protein [Bacillus paranthracis]ONG73520.1 NrdH-redoxin [Bacillus cereus]ONG85865.1 NrdH-redoxin [Bacillus cereus]HDR4569024.1 glutaredoxin family protein [Bacillus paranthracis]
MATKIVMYTGENCGKCKRAKAMLESCPVDVEVIEKNVDENTNYKKDMELLKSTTLPTFVIEGEVYRGFDENIGKIMEHLGL